MNLGDIFLYCGTHRLYRYDGIVRRKLLDINSDIMYTMSIAEDVTDKYDEKFKRLQYKSINLINAGDYQGNGFIYYPDKFPDIHIYEGMKVLINNNTEYYVYGLNDNKFFLIEKRMSIEDFIKARGMKYPSKVEWSKRLFFSGWWKEII